MCDSVRMTSTFTPCEAFASAARYVQRDWGDTGYGIRPIGRYYNTYAFEAICYGDGSYFTVFADQWGNCDYVRDGETIDEAYYRAKDERAARLAALDARLAAR